MDLTKNSKPAIGEKERAEGAQGEAPALTSETLSSALHPPAEPASPAVRARSYPIWLQRTWLVLFVVLCIEVGLVLVVVPWNDAWTSNTMLLFYPSLRYYVNHGFVRGAVTGLGLLDIWIGISQAVRYREK